MARSYKRDARGRFAGGGGGGNRRPATKGFSTGRNRLTRDNSGKITSQGGNGATARGGRLRTAGGNLRARQVGKLKGAPSGVVGRGGKVRGGVIKPKVQPAPAAGPDTRKRVSKKAAAEAKLDRVIKRVGDVGYRRFAKEGQGERARNAIRVERRAQSWINGLAVNVRKPPKTVAEMKSNAAKGMADRKKVRARGELLRSTSATLPISRSRAQRAPKYDQAAVKRRMERYMTGPGSRVHSAAVERASELYRAQLTGQLKAERGAVLPGMKAEGRRRRNANVLKGAKPTTGAPKGGTSRRMKAKGAALGVKAPTRTNKRQQARAAAKVKLDPMQQSENRYQKRKYGIHSTVSNPGIRSRRLPRVTSSTGARIAVRGNRAATRTAYRQRVAATLGYTRKTDMTTLGIGTGLRKIANPRIRKVQTGMTQLSLSGRGTPLTRFRTARRPR